MKDRIDAYRKVQELPIIGRQKLFDRPIELVLLDIDGTILGPCPSHGQAILAAVREAVGFETSFGGVDVAALPDRGIVRALLDRDLGQYDQSIVSKLLTLAGRLFLQIVRDDHIQKIPGIEIFLNHMKAQRIPVGLLTGNLEFIAWRKIEMAGLRDLFLSIGGFGDTAEHRKELFPQALARARELQVVQEPGAVLFIGDSPRDVEVANTFGCQFIGVTTGKFTRREMQIAGADVVVASLLEAVALFQQREGR